MPEPPVDSADFSCIIMGISRSRVRGVANGNPGPARGVMKKRLVLAACLFTLLALNASAHIATTTSLVGTVIDASGKTVPGARVTAVNSGTHDAYTALTSEQGYYNLQFVAVGDYDLRVEHPGFEVMRVTRIHVDIN